jgi:NADPH2:quinone reductase
MNVPYATAYQALFNRAHGQSGPSSSTVPAAAWASPRSSSRARGLTVIGTAGTERGRKLVLSEGAHHVLDHTAPGYLDECVRLTGGQGPAIIMEMLANVNLQKDLGIIGMHGRIVVIGNRGAVEINARFAMNKNANILGMALTHASPFELAGIHAALVEGLRNGSLRPVIAQELPLSQAARSHEAVLEPGHHGKVILVP